MERFIRIGAFIGNICLVVAALFLAMKSYRFDQVLMALLMALPPVLSLITIYCGPDAEERFLKRKLTKARLRRELAELEGQK